MLLARVRGWFTVDGLVNAAILVTCVIVVVAIAERRSTNQTQRGLGPNVYEFKAGQKADVYDGINYANRKVTLVLFLKSTCPYCTQSMAFYRRVEAIVNSRAEVARMVAVSTEPRNVLREYLTTNGLTTACDSVSSQEHPQNTPTILQVDRHGVIQNVWIGLQREAGENEILKTIQQL
jgi:peroxiredoxin